MMGALPVGLVVYVFRVSLMMLDFEKILHSLCCLGVIVLTAVAGTWALDMSVTKPSWVVLALLWATFLDKLGKHIVDRRGE
jgi:hypothetical protein